MNDWVGGRGEGRVRCGLAVVAVANGAAFEHRFPLPSIGWLRSMSGPNHSLALCV